MIDDIDAQETAEWLEALDGVLRQEGPERAQALLEALLDHARHQGAPVTSGLVTPYVNTLSAVDDPQSDETTALEQRIRSYVRWNAIMIVMSYFWSHVRRAQDRSSRRTDRGVESASMSTSSVRVISAKSTLPSSLKSPWLNVLPARL